MFELPPFIEEMEWLKPAERLGFAELRRRYRATRVRCPWCDGRATFRRGGDGMRCPACHDGYTTA